MPPPVVPTLDHLLRHSAFVSGLSRSLLGDHRAEDVAQDVWVAALEGGPRNVEASKTWLGRVVRNRVVNHYRRDGMHRRYEASREPSPPPPEPSEALVREEVRQQVCAALLSLDLLYRTPLVMRFYDGLKPREIAAKLGVPVETVRTRTKRGIAKLRAALDDSCGGRERWGAALLPLAWPDGPPPVPVPAGPPPAASGWAKALLVGLACLGAAVGAILLLWDDDAGVEPVAAVARQDPQPFELVDTAPPRLATTETAPANATPRRPVATWTVEGTVLDSARKPVAGATAVWHRYEGTAKREHIGKTVADANGRFTLSLDALETIGVAHRLTSTLRAQFDGWFPVQGGSVGLAMLRDVRYPVHIAHRVTLAQPALVGSLERAGTPVNGTVVLYTGPLESPAVLWRGATRQGVFRSTHALPDTAFGEPLTLRATTPGHGWVEKRVVLQKGEMNDMGTLAVRPPAAGALTATLRHRNGTPLANVLLRGNLTCASAKRGVFEGPLDTMRATGNRRMDADVRTDAKGRAKFWVPEDARIALYLPGADRRKSAGNPFGPEDREAALVLPGPLVEIRVVDRDGEPLFDPRWRAWGWRRAAAHEAARAAIEAGRPWTSVWQCASTQAPTAVGPIHIAAEPGSTWAVHAQDCVGHDVLAHLAVRSEPAVQRHTLAIDADGEHGSLRVVGPRGSPKVVRVSLRRKPRGAFEHAIVRMEEELHGVPAGSYEVRVRGFPTSAYVWKRTAQVIDGRRTDVAIDDRRTVKLRFRVTAATALAAGKDAGWIHAESLEDPDRKRTWHRTVVHDGAGKVELAPLATSRREVLLRRTRLVLPAGRYRVRYEGAAWRSDPVEVYLRPEDNPLIELRLSPNP